MPVWDEIVARDVPPGFSSTSLSASDRLFAFNISALTARALTEGVPFTMTN